MEGKIVLAGLSPHPPIIVPEVGRGEERNARSTVEAMEELGNEFSRYDFETLILVTPHGPVFSDAVSIRVQDRLAGDLAAFGAGQVEVEFENDNPLCDVIREEAEKGSKIRVLPLNEWNMYRYGIEKDLDHGCLVPLYYLKKHGFKKKLLVINIGFLSYFDLYMFGKDIERACEKAGRKVAILASGDLSHRLKPGAPSGYSPKGEIFDRELVSRLAEFDVEGILTLPRDLVEEAGECGLRPVCILLGALDRAKVQSRVLSYEGPFGVGYCVSVFYPLQWGDEFSRVARIQARRKARIKSLRENESFPVALARKAVEEYVTRGKVIDVPKDVPEEFRGRSGVFVSIHKEGDLRGCIGTTEPTKPSIAEEIISNAISAATNDPRFSPVEPRELDLLDYSVDILSEATLVTDLSTLDPKKYGVICQKGWKRGLLLPDLPGVTTVEEQLSIARKKAGIGPTETGVQVYRFTVRRYH